MAWCGLAGAVDSMEGAGVVGMVDMKGAVWVCVMSGSGVVGGVVRVCLGWWGVVWCVMSNEVVWRWYGEDGVGRVVWVHCHPHTHTHRYLHSLPPIPPHTRHPLLTLTTVRPLLSITKKHLVDVKSCTLSVRAALDHAIFEKSSLFCSEIPAAYRNNKNMTTPR